jgi:hypothetical protein
MRTMYNWTTERERRRRKFFDQICIYKTPYLQDGITEHMIRTPRRRNQKKIFVTCETTYNLLQIYKFLRGSLPDWTLSLPSGTFNTGGCTPPPDFERTAGGGILILLYYHETAGDGFANFFDDANCESASGFEFALEVVGGVTMFSLIPYEDSRKVYVSEEECLSLTKFTWMGWGRADLVRRKSIRSQK